LGSCVGEPPIAEEEKLLTRKGDGNGSWHTKPLEAFRKHPKLLLDVATYTEKRETLVKYLLDLVFKLLRREYHCDEALCHAGIHLETKGQSRILCWQGFCCQSVGPIVGCCLRLEICVVIVLYKR